MAGEKGATYANSLLKLIFQATTIANLADNTATSPNTSLYVSLHTADPLAAGNQSTSEAVYSTYTRATVARTSGGFTVTTNSVSPAATISFPACATIATTAASGTGSAATISWTTALPSAPAVNSTVTIAGMTPSGYNGTFTVTSSTTTSVTFANATTGAQTVAGTILITPPSAASYFAIGTAATGTGVLLYAGPITPTVTINSGVTPQLTTATAISEV
jgi:hypothetical protein